MKKIFTLLAVALIGGSMSVNAQKTWNFSTWEDAEYTSTVTIDALTVVGASGKSIKINSNSKTINGVEYTKRLQFGGSGAEDSRNLNFQVDGPCTIAIGLVTGSSGNARTLNVAAGTFDNIIGTMPAGDDPIEATVSYTGSEPTTIYVYSASSGINIYYITVTPDESAGINGIVAEKETDLNAPVYNLAGQRVDKNTKGILIKNGKKFVNK